MSELTTQDSTQSRSVSFFVNGVRTVSALPDATLLDVLRTDLGLTGTKKGCGGGSAEACRPSRWKPCQLMHPPRP